MAFEQGNTLGSKFSADNQPQSNGRPAGVKNRATIAKQILETILTIPEKQWEKFKQFWPELPQQITGEEMITYAAAYRALKRDTSYRILMDSRYGAPKQEVDMIGEIKITDHKLSIEVIRPKSDDE